MSRDIKNNEVLILVLMDNQNTAKKRLSSMSEES